MQNKNAKASRVSATFGYDTMDVMGFNLYTFKLRVKQFDLLRCLIEYDRRNNPQGFLYVMKHRLVESKNGNTYVYYQFATTDENAAYLMKRELDKARAGVKQIECDRLLKGERFYKPDYLAEMECVLRDEERRSYNRYERSEFDDLPF
mgnify:CR=1 FL=1|tara:strand:+ start:25 stop:468 length:444 start_codon:yes stop_codon:yes gene_type:complete